MHRGLARPRRAAAGGRSARDRAAARAARRDRRLDLHLLADARRLHHADARRRRQLAVHRQRRLRAASASRTTSRSRPRSPSVPLAVMGIYLLHRPAPRRVRGALMEQRAAPASRSRVWTALVARVPLGPDRDHLRLRVQQLERPELADRRASRRSGSRSALARPARCSTALLALAQGRRASRPRSRSCSARRPRSRVHRFRFFGREAISFVLRAADRAARDHHRHGAELVLRLPADQLLALDDRDRPRDLLRRDRLQQRARAAAAHARRRSSRPRWTSARAAGRRSAS